jgi:hypothetical protein
MTIFCCSCFANKAKKQHGKNQNKNTGLFINCMDFVIVRTKINKKKNLHFFRMLGPCLCPLLIVYNFWFEGSPSTQIRCKLFEVSKKNIKRYNIDE